MAIEWESSCVDCPSMGLPCQGSSCRNHDDYPILKCDRCRRSFDRLYIADGEELCESCLLEDFEFIDVEDLV